MFAMDPTREPADCANSKKKALEFLIVAYFVFRTRSFNTGSVQLTQMTRASPSRDCVADVIAEPHIVISFVKAPYTTVSAEAMRLEASVISTMRTL